MTQKPLELRGAATEAVILEALTAAVIVTDVQGRVFLWNRAAERLYGYPREQMLGASVLDLFVRLDDQEEASEIMVRVLAGETWSGEFPVRCADGTSRLVRITDAPVRVDGETVAVVGIADDITEEHARSVHAHDRDEQLRLALAAAELGTWHWDLATGLVRWDERMEAMFGLSPGSFDGSYEGWLDLVHPDDRDRVRLEVQTAADRRSSYDVRHRAVRPDGTIRWIEGLGRVRVGADGTPTGSIGCARDVSSRMETEHLLDEALDHAQTAAVRLQRLQAVTADLAAAMTVQDVVDVVREHAREAIGATVGSIVIPTPRGDVLERAAFFGESGPLRDRYAAVPVGADVPVAVAARTGEAIYLSSRAALVAEYADIGPVMEAMHVEALAVVPILRGPSDVAGVLVLACAEPRAFGADDRALLESVAAQCAVSLERARLLEQSQRIADRLQAGLGLDDVPAVPLLDVGTIYRPGGDEAEHLGGDWFDVLPQPDGTVVLVIGDVMGRGVDAAATMTRVRSAIRAFASVDADPLVVLRKADAFAAREWPEQFITVLYVRLDPRTGEVTVANAGHLPPVLLDDDAVLMEIEGSPPLGLPMGDRRTRAAGLEPGAALLLVTDGLVERPGHDVYAGLAAVSARARELLGAAETAQSTVQRLVDEAGPAELADDVTVVLVRRPRSEPATSSDQ